MSPGLASSLAHDDKRMGAGEKEDELGKEKEGELSFPFPPLSPFLIPFLPLPFVYHQERDLKQVQSEPNNDIRIEYTVYPISTCLKPLA